MAVKTVEQVTAEAEGYAAAFASAKTVVAREEVCVKWFALSDDHPWVDVPGLGGARLKAKRAHLREVTRSIEIAEAKTSGGAPALGGRVRDLRSEQAFLTRSIRSEEARVLATLEGIES